MVGLPKNLANCFCNISVEVVSTEKLEHCHTLVDEKFWEEKLPIFYYIGGNFQKIREILEIMKRYKMPLIRTPVQEKTSH